MLILDWYSELSVYDINQYLFISWHSIQVWVIFCKKFWFVTLEELMAWLLKHGNEILHTNFGFARIQSPPDAVY